MTNAASAELQLILVAKDQASASLKNIEGQLGKLGSAVKSMIAPLAAMAGGFASFKTLQGAVNATQELGLAVKKLSRETGLSAEESSRMIFALEHSGLEAISASKAYGILAKGLSEFTAGLDDSGKTTNSVRDILKELGVSAFDASGQMKPLGDILPQISDLFHGTADNADKTALALKLFGRAGEDLVPFLNLGTEQIKALGAEADKLGVTLTAKNVKAIQEYTFAQRTMNEALNGLKLQIGLAVMPVLTRFADWFIEHQPEIRRFFDTAIAKVSEFATSFYNGMTKVVIPALQWIPNNQGVIIAAIAAIGAAMILAFGPASAVIVGLGALIVAMGLIVTKNGELGDSALDMKMHFLDAIADILNGLADVVTAAINAGVAVSTMGIGNLASELIKGKSPGELAASPIREAANNAFIGAALAEASSETAKILREQAGAVEETIKPIKGLGIDLDKTSTALKSLQDRASELFSKDTIEEAQLRLEVAMAELQGHTALAESLRKQLGVMDAFNTVQTLRLKLADSELLTEEEQNRMTELFIGQLGGVQSSLGDLNQQALIAAAGMGEMTHAVLAAVPAWRAVTDWRGGGSVPHMAGGGIVSRPTLALIGERGPEAVVPLGRGGGMTVVYVPTTGAPEFDRAVERAVVDAARRGGFRGVPGLSAT